jgi:hypothetical protein
MLDPFQLVAVSFGVFQICLIIVYLIFFVDPPETMFVSDLLFKDVIYMTLMSLCVVGQLVFCACYAFRHRKEYPFEFYTMIIAVTSAVVGWFLLNSFYINSSNEITVTHVVGVSLFILGSVVYMSFLVRDSWYAYIKTKTHIFLCRAVVITILSAACLALGGMFMDAFINHHIVNSDVRTSTVSWVYEHTGYLLFTLAHVMFFADETPDPFNHKKNTEQSVVKPVGYGVCGVPITPEHCSLLGKGGGK